MKLKIAILLCVAVIATVMLTKSPSEQNDVIRIHIRASDDSTEAQRVKYEVKDAVVEYLTPVLAECATQAEARRAVQKNMGDIIGVANSVLDENAVNYRASAKLVTEKFPTRAYGDLVLNEGEYESLIVELGEGDGQNWWCVLYPPLCFVPTDTGDGNVRYKSKILEIINNYNGG